jgi:hypothetical protein
MRDDVFTLMQACPNLATLRVNVLEEGDLREIPRNIKHRKLRDLAVYGFAATFLQHLDLPSLLSLAVITIGSPRHAPDMQAITTALVLRSICPLQYLEVKISRDSVEDLKTILAAVSPTLRALRLRPPTFYEESSPEHIDALIRLFAPVHPEVDTLCPKLEYLDVHSAVPFTTRVLHEVITAKMERAQPHSGIRPFKYVGFDMGVNSEDRRSLIALSNEAMVVANIGRTFASNAFESWYDPWNRSVNISVRSRLRLTLTETEKRAKFMTSYLFDLSSSSLCGSVATPS